MIMDVVDLHDGLAGIVVVVSDMGELLRIRQALKALPTAITDRNNAETKLNNIYGYLQGFDSLPGKQ